MNRIYTDKLITIIEEGMVDAKSLAEQLAYWIGEDDAKEFWYANGYSELDDSEEDEDIDFNSVASPHHY